MMLYIYTKDQNLLENIQDTLPAFIEKNHLSWQIEELSSHHMNLILSNRRQEEKIYFQADIETMNQTTSIKGMIEKKQDSEKMKWYDWILLVFIFIIIFIPYALYCFFHFLYAKVKHIEKKTDLQWLDEYFIHVLSCKKE